MKIIYVLDCRHYMHGYAFLNVVCIYPINLRSKSDKLVAKEEKQIIENWDLLLIVQSLYLEAQTMGTQKFNKQILRNFTSIFVWS